MTTIKKTRKHKMYNKNISHYCKTHNIVKFYKYKYNAVTYDIDWNWNEVYTPGGTESLSVNKEPKKQDKSLKN